MAILKTDKTDFKAKRQRITLYINERFNTARDVTTINIYAHNDKVPMKQKLAEWKKRINSSIIIVGDFNISLTVMNRPTSQKIGKQRT